jgi:hypothetical protein
VLAKIEFVSGVLNIYKTISCGVDFGTEKILFTDTAEFLPALPALVTNRDSD